MGKILNSEKIPITCSNCNHTVEKTIQWLRVNKYLTCSRCDYKIKIESRQFIREMDKVEKSFKQLEREFKKLGDIKIGF